MMTPLEVLGVQEAVEALPAGAVGYQELREVASLQLLGFGRPRKDEERRSPRQRLRQRRPAAQRVLDTEPAQTLLRLSAAEMGAWALLLPLLLVGAAQAQVCSVGQNFFEVKENTNVTEPLVDIYVPDDQQVTLGSSSTLFAFRIQGTQLFLNMTPDYEENSLLQALLECKRGDTVVTQLRVFVSVLDVNDNAPTFPFVVRVERVPENAKVNTTVIPETELQAEDLDKNDILFYTLEEVTPGASVFFSLVGVNLPALQLDRTLDLDRWPNMTFRLLVRDTREENVTPSHTATATLVLEVEPVDLRPPWFLPCSYTDSYVCIEAQYQGAVPTSYQLLSPLILHPGPIYAVDGDRAINQRIIYSIIGGHEDIFTIDADSGNLTMTQSVPSPKTFLMWVKGEQADQARYSVTQVTVEALDAAGSLPYFPESLYRGTVVLGSGVGEFVKDAATPSQALRIQAQDPEFPDLNSAITYRITNNSDFRMEGEAVLVANPLTQAGVFYSEVEATNTATGGTATTLVEIQVSEQEPTPTPTDPPGPSTSPEAGGTAGPSSSTTSETPRPSGPSQGPSMTSAGGDTGPHSPPGTTLRPPASTTPGGPPSAEISTSPPSASPSGGSAQTQKPGISQPTAPGLSRTSQPSDPKTGSALSGQRQTGPGGPEEVNRESSLASLGDPGNTAPWGGGQYCPLSRTLTPGGGQAGFYSGSSELVQAELVSTCSADSKWAVVSPAGTPGIGGGSTSTGGVGPDGSHAGDRRFSTAEMAAVGGVLGALLLLALIALTILGYKHYGHLCKSCASKALEPQPRGFDKAFLTQDRETNWEPAPSPTPGPTPDEAPPEPPEPAPPSPVPSARVPESPAAAQDGAGPAEVRSILTKERRPEGGYKAVWFGEDIGAEADVVVLNAPTSEANGAGDSDSEGGGEDEGAGAGPGAGAPDQAPGDSTYV
ncbi:PREDICTED: cadherin-related family member 5 [Ceratotherium simum simum]|uniref:Cadherin-related family member 5 n=1 Tax=Ceratotherium simum simum TaxID=73337 RepID=A0ABM1DHD9_CERSS|nr:PREDICTED: cadherin-related family member 5 [Ceratotherium simum simum]